MALACALVHRVSQHRLDLRVIKVTQVLKRRQLKPLNQLEKENGEVRQLDQTFRLRLGLLLLPSETSFLVKLLVSKV